MSFRSRTTTVREYAKEIPKIATDDSFERPYGCWSSYQRNNFLLSVFKRGCGTPISLAHTQECYEFAIDSQDEDSISYYGRYVRSEKHGGAGRTLMRFISLDGKHRTQTIKLFLNNKVSITGRLVGDDGSVYIAKNCYFKDLPSGIQNTFLMKPININEYYDEPRSELPEIFRDINSGAGPTPQHLRNTYATPFSKATRDLRSALKSTVVDTFYPSSHIAAMKPEEDISKVYIHIDKRQSSVKRGDLDKLYRLGESVGVTGNLDSVYNIATWDITSRLFSELEFIVSNGKSQEVKKNSLLLYTLALQKVVEHGLSVIDADKFVKELSKLDKDLVDRSRGQQQKDLKDPDKPWAGQASSYYYEWHRLNWSEARYSRQDRLWRTINRKHDAFGLGTPNQLAAK
jgi:hypothetical protein